MKQFYLLLFALTLQLSIFAQNKGCNYRLTCKVLAPSGLSLRSSPSLTAKVVTYAPENAIVSACELTAGKLVVEGIEGFWRPVEYNGKKGFMFDGFLEIKNYQKQTTAKFDSLKKDTDEGKPQSDSLRVEVNPIAKEKKSLDTPPEHPFVNEASEIQILTETYNFCGAVETIDPGLLWYGFYLDDEKNGDGNFSIKPAALSVVLSQRRLSKNLEFDITTESDDRSLFLIGLNRKLSIEKLQIPDITNELRIRGRKIFPGQRVELYAQQNLTLTATGAVITSGDCPELKDYSVQLNGFKNGKEYSQSLLALVGDAGQCGMPELYWYGDFTGDGLPEIILVSVYPNKNIFTLLTSRGTNNLMIKEAVFSVESCN